MARTAALLTLLLALVHGPAAAQTAARESASPLDAADLAALVTPPAGTPDHERLAPVAAAARAAGEIVIDGRLDEAAWEAATPLTRFFQLEPVQGHPGSQATEIRFLYDDRNLYVGARMHDAAGSRGIVQRLARRDADSPGDNLELVFDTFLDHVGRSLFRINAAGVRGDSYGPAGSALDSSWDPIWRARTTVDSLGWTAEIEIPFSQLRFRSGGEQVWGLQIWRYVERLNETQMWSFWRRDDQGGPARFGHLTGIEVPGSGADRLSLLPYVVTQTRTTPDVDPDDPFARGTDTRFRTGLDLKYLLTSDLTLSGTVNPDFGQAEVDPAVVNLSAFETFFPEKREFFIEGRGLFQYGGLWCFTCSNISSLDLLFTRRIGRFPQGAGLAASAGRFADVPDASTILGAAKLTGRIRSGTSIGGLAAVTDREEARVVEADGRRFDVEVEPLTTYGVARVKQDLMDGDLQVGAMATSVVRRFDDPALEERLPSHAEAVGLDAEAWWGNRSYHLLANAAFSNVSGSEAAILRLQRSSARYFQRPDRDYGVLDPTLESLQGYGTYTRIAKEAGTWRWEGSFASRSPGFEINDLGFQTRTDFLWLHGNLQRRWTEPTPWYRYVQVTGGGQRRWNYDGDMTESQLHGSVYVTTPFYWDMSLFGLVRPRALDDRLTRGGPVVGAPRIGYVSLYAATDRRKPVFVEFNPTTGWSEEGTRDIGVGVTVVMKPASNVRLSFGPRIEKNEYTAQFVTAVDDPTAEAFYGRRYVFADLDQRIASMNTRLNWTFSPSMSLELFAQPLVSSNDFSRFKEFAAPRRLDKVVYGEDAGIVGRDGGDIVVDPDGAGPAATFRFANPDFNFRSLRGNLVYRWEYRPGSTLFLVWTQDRNSTAAIGDFDLGRDLGGLFDIGARNIFLVKATYWLGL